MGAIPGLGVPDTTTIGRRTACLSGENRENGKPDSPAYGAGLPNEENGNGHH